MAEPVYIGVDPGASGGLASIWSSFVSARSMPSTERDIFDWAQSIKQCYSGVTFAVIEKVGGYRRGTPAPGSAMFNFGLNYGGLRMALIACGIPFEEVMPNRWQQSLGIKPREPHTKTREVETKKGKNKGKMRTEWYGGESESEWKNRLRAKAQQLFPGEKITLAVADALLIAEYCRRKRQGTLAAQPEPVASGKAKQEVLF